MIIHTLKDRKKTCGNIIIHKLYIYILFLYDHIYNHICMIKIMLNENGKK